MNLRLANVWRRLLDDLSLSTLPLSEWCKLHGVTISQYRRWKRKLKPASADSPADGRWVAVHIEQPASDIPTPARRSGVILRIGSATLEIEAGFDPATLRAVLQALGAPPC